MSRIHLDRLLLVVPVAGLLIAAALLKTYQLAVSPATANYLLESRGLTILLIEFELFMAFWLLSGIAYPLARRAGLALFALFAAVSLVKAVGGETSCGCLGVIQVHPWVMLGVDVLAIGLLSMAGRRRPHAVENSGTRALLTRGLPVVGGILMLGVLFPIFGLKTTTLDDDGGIADHDGLVIIEPENWIGKPFPLATFIERSDKFLDGEWHVVLYREDCPVCQQHIRMAAGDPDHPATAFIEVPPWQSPRRRSRDNLLWLRLRDARDWFVEAPSTMVLQDGVVRQFIPREASH